MRSTNDYFNRFINRMGILKRKFLRNINDYGLWISLKKIAGFSLNPFYQKKAFILYKINIEATPKRTSPKNGLVFKLLKPEDTIFINQIEEMEEWLEGKVKPKLLAGGMCMAVIQNDRLIGFNLASLGEGFIPLLKLKVITRPDEAWSEQITIHKDYRREGLGSELRNRFYVELRKKGIKALYGHRQEFNITSEKSARRYISKYMVKAEYLSFLHYQRLRYAKLSLNLTREKTGLNKKDLKIKSKKYYHNLSPSNRLEYPFTVEITDLDT